MPIEPESNEFGGLFSFMDEENFSINLSDIEENDTQIRTIGKNDDETDIADRTCEVAAEIMSDSNLSILYNEDIAQKRSDDNKLMRETESFPKEYANTKNNSEIIEIEEDKAKEIISQNSKRDINRTDKNGERDLRHPSPDEDFYYIMHTPLIKLLFETELQSLSCKLSVRTRNALSSVLDLKGMFQFRDPETRKSLFDIKGCGRNGIEEYSDLVDKFWKFYDSVYGNLKSNPETIDEYKERIVRNSYPYVSTVEGISYVANKLSEMKSPEPEFLFYHYIMGTESLPVSTVRRLMGHSENMRSKLLLEVAAETKRSRERIRQIISSALPVEKKYSVQIEGAFKDINKPVISSSDKIWSEIAAKSGIEFLPTLDMMALAQAWYGYYTIIDIEEKPGTAFLVHRDLLRNIRFRSAYAAIINKMTVQRMESENIDLLTYLLDEKDQIDYHPDVAELCQVIKANLKEKSNFKETEGTTIILPPNKFDKVKGLISILEEVGHPMSFNDLSEAYKQKYPDYPFSSDESLKSYALRFPGIVPIGKTGYYTLPKWKTYTGTITAKLYDILSEQDAPLTLQELVDKAKIFFPSTTPERIAGLIYADRADRFIVYADNLYGVKEKADKYGEGLKERPEIVRKSPEERLAELECFIQQEGRFPYSASTNPEERTLYNWIGNIKGEIVNCSPKIKEDLEYLTEKYPLAPKSGDDIRFVMRCNEIIDYARTKRRFPSGEKFEKTIKWFHFNMTNKKNLSSLRSYYFTRLINSLKRFGINFEK